MPNTPDFPLREAIARIVKIREFLDLGILPGARKKDVDNLLKYIEEIEGLLSSALNDETRLDAVRAEAVDKILESFIGETEDEI